MPDVEKLIAARKAVEAMQPDIALELLEEYHEGLTNGAISADDAGKVSAELRVIQSLAGAALAGVAAAQSLVKEFLELAQGFNSYDRHGQRRTAQTRAREARKF